MLRLGVCSVALAFLAVLLVACGPDAAKSNTPAGATTGVPSARGLFVGQEIWLTYESPRHAKMGIRVNRPREDARALAEDLRAQVLKGADVGVLAQVHSNAPGARAEGFSGVLPRDPQNPDERDRALMTVPIGGVTALVDWNGGWWFAKRVTPEAGQTLEKMFRVLVQAGEEARKTEVRARAIIYPYVGSFPFRHDVTDTQDKAEEKARKVIRALQGGADFDQVAKTGIAEIPLSGSWDEASGPRGGVLLATQGPGEGGRWISRFDEGYPEALLRLLFEAPLGLYPEPIVTARGVVIAEIQERRKRP